MTDPVDALFDGLCGAWNGPSDRLSAHLGTLPPGSLAARRDPATGGGAISKLLILRPCDDAAPGLLRACIRAGAPVADETVCGMPPTVYLHAQASVDMRIVAVLSDILLNAGEDPFRPLCTVHPVATLIATAMPMVVGHMAVSSARMRIAGRILAIRDGHVAGDAAAALRHAGLVLGPADVPGVAEGAWVVGDDPVPDDPGFDRVRAAGMICDLCPEPDRMRRFAALGMP